MLAVHEAVHDRARQEREIGDAAQQCWVEEGGRRRCHQTQSADLGSGMAASSLVTS